MLVCDLCSPAAGAGTENKMTENLYSDDYSKFGAGSYLRTRYSNPEEGKNPFFLQCFHDFVKHYKSKWDPGTALYLEFGGGPNIMPLISIAPHVSKIVFSDYAEENRKEVELWRNGRPESHDWTPFMKYVVNELEENSDSESAQVRENLIRAQICIIPCDILSSDGILGNPAAANTQYDIISTSGCIEAAVISESQYRDCLVKLRNLLKPEGFLIGMAFLGVGWWEVQGMDYHAFPITEDGFIAALQQAGLILLEKRLTTVKGHSLSDVKGVLFYVAKPVTAVL